MGALRGGLSFPGQELGLLVVEIEALDLALGVSFDLLDCLTGERADLLEIDCCWLFLMLPQLLGISLDYGQLGVHLSLLT